MNVRSRNAAVMAVVGAMALVLVFPAAASAHVTRRVGGHEVVVGWSNEPAFAGFGNEVQVIISHGREPVEDAELEAVVSFGGEDSGTESDPVPLEPAFDSPGEYLGYMIPTRPGTYSFHITGTVEGEEFDEVFTSGPDTFSDMENPTDVAFPAQDPTAGELAQALDRLSGRIEDLQADVTSAEEEGDSNVALWIAIGAGVLALIALAVGARRRSSA
jgi:hypothetical protein